MIGLIRNRSIKVLAPVTKYLHNLRQLGNVYLQTLCSTTSKQNLFSYCIQVGGHYSMAI